MTSVSLFVSAPEQSSLHSAEQFPPLLHSRALAVSLSRYPTHKQHSNGPRSVVGGQVRNNSSVALLTVVCQLPDPLRTHLPSYRLGAPVRPMSEQKRFERRDALGLGVKGALIVGGVGTMLSGVQNSLAKQNVGVFGVITRTGGTIGIFGRNCKPLNRIGCREG